ncbi:MAG: hypothetical protein LBU50_01190, partial [Cellulomonas sp.]|nr:hypothetical protein [Cellulomonas sp.]
VSIVLALWLIYVHGFDLVIGTAQDLDVAEDIWATAVEIAEDNPELAAEIKRIVKTNGQKSLELVSRRRYKVKATGRRAGRSLSADMLMLDELREHQTWDAWAALTKTTMAKSEALILALSNAGDASSVVLRHLRAMAHEALGDPDGIVAARQDPGPPTVTDTDDEDGDGEPEDEDPDQLAIFEWSMPPGVDKWDRDGWAQANPAMGHVIPERNIAQAVRTDPDPVVRTEVFCQWVDFAKDGPFPPGAWQAGTDPASTIPEDSPVVYGLDVSTDRTHTHIAVAGRQTDGLVQVEFAASRAGTDWPVGWFGARAGPDRPMTVVVQARGAPASSLLEDLAQVEHLDVVEVGGPDLASSTAKIYDLVTASGWDEQEDGPPVRRGLVHLPWPVLDVAAAVAVPKILDGGGMAWDRKKSPVDIAPLVAATFAVWAADRPAPPPLRRSAYETTSLMVLD